MRMRFRTNSPHAASALSDFHRNERGSTAIEFAVIGGALIFFILGIVGLGIFFLVNSSLQSGVENAARIIRTGQSNEAKMNVTSFRQAVCDSMNAAIDCNKLSILVQTAPDWANLNLAPCVVNGKMSASTGNGDDLLSKHAGDAEEVAVVTVCYQWDMAKSFPFLKLGNQSDGSGAAIMQAATAFRSEPYK
ncbi:TadE/TadG family type IV pilus assembly protein [Hyphomicrobium sulfonivorans]|uniref:TadE/TadG family type IV pilus assembly protein n=1 Tax=Hyphomicrobium sulfonivorans TaxID=121290 RepID=UPI00156E723B|nr:TadE/TadG family type IV pilus assembly protein [Hyphomicrobium sulfonivorans]MBI1649901.1 pilus assembly protein [Hyphomicrobium sulfonivorans]NSL72819.1 pilus assembly protein [Hyphomicrobium sulfonivorans]